MDMFDPNVLATLASVGGMGVSIADWFRGLSSEKRRALESDRIATIADYLEWLRRKNHNEIIEAISESSRVQDDVHHLLTDLLTESDRNVKEILEYIRAGDHFLKVQFEQINRQLEGIEASIELFEPATAVAQEETHFEEAYLDRVEMEFDRLRMLGVREMRDVQQPLSIAYVSLMLGGVGEQASSQRAEHLMLQHPLLTIRWPWLVQAQQSRLDLFRQL